MDKLEQALYDAILEFDEDSVIEKTKALVDAKKDPVTIANLCRTAMDEIGRMFQEKEIFLTELIMAGELMNVIMNELGFSKDANSKPDSEYIGKVVIGTVQGDVHDIGKNIVVSLLSSNNIKVIDIGVDCTPEKFVDAVKKHNPQVVGLSGLLTIAYESMKKIVTALTEAGLHNNIKIMIGGGATDQKVCDFAGADAYGKDATDAILMCQRWMKK